MILLLEACRTPVGNVVHQKQLRPHATTRRRNAKLNTSAVRKVDCRTTSVVMRLYILAQHGIDHGLVAFSLLFEKLDHIGIYAQSDLLLVLRPPVKVNFLDIKNVAMVGIQTDTCHGDINATTYRTTTAGA
jgi:hypothetical protein